MSSSVDRGSVATLARSVALQTPQPEALYRLDRLDHQPRNHDYANSPNDPGGKAAAPVAVGASIAPTHGAPSLAHPWASQDQQPPTPEPPGAEIPSRAAGSFVPAPGSRKESALRAAEPVKRPGHAPWRPLSVRP